MIKWLYVSLLTYFTGEIILRRELWGQVPTQIPALVVFATLAINSFVLWRLLVRAVPAVGSRTPEKR